jgi:hypothetical protein
VRSSRSVNDGVRAALLASALLIAAVPAGVAFAQEGKGRTPEQLLPEAPPPPRILEEERARRNASGSARARGGASDASRSNADTEAVGGAEARDGTAPAPPAISDTGLAPALAAPRPDASDDLDEVLVVGTALRLPDLGSSLRTQREAEREAGRISATFLPLYDPEAAHAGFDDALFRNRELERVGFIELFRLRFGKRSKK